MGTFLQLKIIDETSPYSTQPSGECNFFSGQRRCAYLDNLMILIVDYTASGAFDHTAKPRPAEIIFLLRLQYNNYSVKEREPTKLVGFFSKIFLLLDHLALKGNTDHFVETGRMRLSLRASGRHVSRAWHILLARATPHREDAHRCIYVL